MERTSIYEKLLNIQTELKAPKGQYNSFGKYKFRSCEDILEAVKPILKKNRVALTLSDELIILGNNEPVIYDDLVYDKELKKEVLKKFVISGQRYYIKATATLYDLDSDEDISNTALAREEETKKGMDGSQITGTASSYARKYALNGLFAIDDTKDADTNEFTEITKEEKEEKVEITKEDAEGYVFGFGKHQGEQLADVVVDDPQYLDWLVNNGKADATLKKCIQIVKAAEKEEDDKLILISEMNQLEIDTNSDHEEILKHYKVSSNQEMTIEQLNNCIAILKKKLPKNDVTPYDF